METTPHADRMIGESSSFLQMQEQVSRLAPLHKPVLIIGERGTGKELVAARLHYLSPRWDESFIKINCAAFNESLLDSQLFGHEVGAFTGASRQQKGLFERADKGTLFLDEIANSSLHVQEKILRVTEYGELERLGGHRPVTVDVRIVAAANVDLPELATQGKFRLDLLDRLAFDVITLPPLRERQEDIPILAHQFAINMTKEMGRSYFPGFSKRALSALQAYTWPGNIRELKNVVERCVYRSEDPDSVINRIVFDPFDSPYRLSHPLTTAQTPTPKAVQLAPSASEHTPESFKDQVHQYERDLLSDALAAHQFNQKKTARALGLTYDQLRGYLKKYSLV